MSLLEELDLLNNFNGDPFISSNTEVVDGNDAPLVALKFATIQLLSTLLNPIKIIPTDSGLPRDWRGLAELAGMTAESMNYLEMKSDPLSELLKLLPKSSTRLKTVKDLRAFLAIIDRFDVVDDGESLFESDIIFYKSRVNQISLNSKSPAWLDPEIERDLLTYDDTIAGDKKIRYDAFILYADEDSEFASEVVTKLETEYNLKLCVKDRDLLPGVRFEYEAVGKLIEQRCNRLLVLFSPNFLQSEGNQFLVSFTQALALETRQRKIIPCMYKRCELPMSVRYSFCLDYNRAGKLWNFWEKLSKSLESNSPNTSISTPMAALVKTGTSLPETSSWWDSKQVDQNEDSEPPLSSFDRLSINSHNPLLSSSLPKYSTAKSNTKKWYKKVIGSSKKKKENDKQGKLLTTAD